MQIFWRNWACVSNLHLLDLRILHHIHHLQNKETENPRLCSTVKGTFRVQLCEMNSSGD